jgi:hypothetical protein
MRQRVLAQPLQFVGCSAQSGLSLLYLGRIAIDDGSAAFRRDDAVYGILQHEDGIAHAKGESAAGAAFADTDHHHGHREARHFAEIARDGLGLSALLGVDSGIGAWSVQKGNDRPAELGGHLHDAQRLAVALGLRHAEIAEKTLFGIATLLLGHDHHRTAFELGEAGDDRRVVTEVAVAVNLLKVLENAADVVEGMRTFGVAGKLDAPPGGITSGCGVGHAGEVFFGIHSFHITSE